MTCILLGQTSAQQGLPSGGTVGQILIKTETGAEWADLDAATEAYVDSAISNLNNTLIDYIDNAIQEAIISSWEASY